MTAGALTMDLGFKSRTTNEHQGLFTAQPLAVHTLLVFMLIYIPLHCVPPRAFGPTKEVLHVSCFSVYKTIITPSRLMPKSEAPMSAGGRRRGAFSTVCKQSIGLVPRTVCSECGHSCGCSSLACRTFGDDLPASSLQQQLQIFCKWSTGTGLPPRRMLRALTTEQC